MVRPSYRANFTSGTGDSADPAKTRSSPWCSTPTSRTSRAGDHDRDDLLGGYPAPRRYIGWQTFFDFGDGQVKNEQEDRHHDLQRPVHAAAAGDRAAHPDRARSCCPSATCCASSPGACPRARRSPARWASTADSAPISATSPASTAVRHAAPRSGTTSSPRPRPATGGLHLGPVGGRIVAETLIGLLRADPTSYLSANPRFRPFLGADLQDRAKPEHERDRKPAYTRAHFLHYAEVLDAGVYR